MKDSQVRIRIPIHHASEHHRTLPAEESPGHIAAPPQTSKLAQQRSGTRGTLPAEAGHARRATAVATALHPAGASPPTSGAAARGTRGTS
ncbi:stage II sporulation protein D, partial [Paenibacillus peoriae]|nr:stage II sporulation protein D [Paenibacillus peoriae]